MHPGPVLAPYERLRGAQRRQAAHVVQQHERRGRAVGRIAEPEAARGRCPEAPQGRDLAVAQMPAVHEAALRHLHEAGEEGGVPCTDGRAHGLARRDREKRAAVAHVRQHARAAVARRGVSSASSGRAGGGRRCRSDARPSPGCRRRAARPPRRRARDRRAPRCAAPLGPGSGRLGASGASARAWP